MKIWQGLKDKSRPLSKKPLFFSQIRHSYFSSLPLFLLSSLKLHMTQIRNLYRLLSKSSMQCFFKSLKDVPGKCQCQRRFLPSFSNPLKAFFGLSLLQPDFSSPLRIKAKWKKVGDSFVSSLFYVESGKMCAKRDKFPRPKVEEKIQIIYLHTGKQHWRPTLSTPERGLRYFLGRKANLMEKVTSLLHNRSRELTCLWTHKFPALSLC